MPSIIDPKYERLIVSGLGILSGILQLVLDLHLPDPWNRIALLASGALALYGFKPRGTIDKEDAPKVAAEQGFEVRPSVKPPAISGQTAPSHVAPPSTPPFQGP
jgi:hypothetical protein